MNNPQQPREYDAVLGGNSPSLEGAAVLGGIEGVKLRLKNPDAKVRITALEQALNYGEQGLDLVIAGLKDESWDIQNAAHLILNPRTEPRIKQILQKPNHEGLKLEQIEVVTVNNFGEIIQRQQRVARYFTEYLDNGVTLEMSAIPGGTFMMGSPENEEGREGRGREKSESPQHEVTVPSFFIGKYPITQAQYQAIMETNPSWFKGDNRPVEQVSWDDAVAFCRKLSRITGNNYRLPSEAEWEYACRAETTTPFYFGENITPNLVNYNGNYPYTSAQKGQYREQTTDVGTFPPNAFGLYDMHGNVSEWCQDYYQTNYITAPTDGSAVDSKSAFGGSDSVRRRRGGSWLDNAKESRSAQRDCYSRDFRRPYVGFRVVCSRPLGGIDGVKLQLKSPELKARISALEKALNYGEQGLDLVIEGLKDESWDVRKQAYIILQNRAESKVKQALTIFEEKKLKSSVGVDYRNLRNLLAQGKWKEADEETRRVMFALAKADQEYEQVRSSIIQTLHLRKQKIQNEEIYIQYFTANYILIAQEKIPREDLHTIDQLWVKHSNGRFGFSVQKHIYQSLGGTRWFNEETTQAFAKKVGWEKKNDFVMYYSDITFDITAPEGHLPVIIDRLHPSDYDFLTNAIANFQLLGKPWRVPVVTRCDISYFRFLLLS